MRDMGCPVAGKMWTSSIPRGGSCSREMAFGVEVRKINVRVVVKATTSA